MGTESWGRSGGQGNKWQPEKEWPMNRRKTKRQIPKPREDSVSGSWERSVVPNATEK